MTFPLTLIVIVLGLSPVDSDARTGPARPINRSNLECRPFLPRRLTQLRRIDLDHRSRAQTSRSPLERSNQDSTSSPNKPSPLSPSRPTSPGFVQSGFYEVALTTRAPGPFSHATSQNPQDSRLRSTGRYRQTLSIVFTNTADRARRCSARRELLAQLRRVNTHRTTSGWWRAIRSLREGVRSPRSPTQG